MFARFAFAVLFVSLSSSAVADGNVWKRELRYFARGVVSDTMYLGGQYQYFQYQGQQAGLNLYIQGAQQAQSLYYEDQRARMEAERRREEEAYRNRERCSYTYNESIVNGVPASTAQGRQCTGTREEAWIVGTTSIPYQSNPVTVGKQAAVASAPVTLTPEEAKRLADNADARRAIQAARAAAKANGN